MKNIAIPLLLAGSAKAEAKKKAAMLIDYAMPEPILIASSWTGDVCEDAAGDVAQALSDLQAAQGELGDLEEEVEALDEAEGEAIETRLEAVAAVVELDEEMEADVEANNDDIAALIGLKEAWQEANVAASIGEALVTDRLGAKNTAADDYDQAETDYSGEAGLLSVTEGLDEDLDDAEEVEAGSGVGSTTARDAAHVDYACTDCSANADAGTVGADDFVVECDGSYMGAESADYTGMSGFPNSLSELETTADTDLDTKEAKDLTKAAKYLLKVEYNQIQKYLTYATAQAAKDAYTSGSEADFDSSVNYEHYAGGHEDLLTQAEIITEMENGNNDLDETLTGETGATAAAMQSWVDALRLVYGKVTGVGTQDNEANDGNGNDVDSQEWLAQQTGATGYADWVTDAQAQVEALKAYMVAYNALEIGTDGYENAYTEVKGDTSSSGEWTGGCTDVSSSSVNMNLPADTAGGYDSTATFALSWITTATQDSEVTALGTSSSGAESLSICAYNCSLLLNWGALTATNMPFTYTPATNVLTSSDAGASTQSVTTMTASYCLGFEADTTVANELECENYFEAFPTENTAETADHTELACYTRNSSVKAQTYSNSLVYTAAEDGSDNFDYFEVAMTNWATAYETLIGLRADLDIAVYYSAQLLLVNDDATANNAVDYGYEGFIQRYNHDDSGTITGALIEYTDASTDYTDASEDYVTSLALYSARAVEIASANSDYMLAQAQWEENNALISKLTVLSEIATAASDASQTAMGNAEDAEEDAADDWSDAVDAYSGVEAFGEDAAVDGLLELQEAAEEAYDDASDDVYGEEGTNTALGEYEDGGTGDLGSLFGLRADALDAYEELQDAMSDLSTLNGDIMGAAGDVEEALAVHLSAIVACKVENYDNYLETLQLAQQQRQDDLDDILALVTEAEEDAPEAGAAGSRCEKAMSNGTFRPVRGETTCNEGLCCGAARIPMGNVMMTVETCQAEGSESYEYVPPRAPMATAAPTAETVDFVCITGAKKLAAAASALATAVYMLA